MKKVFAVTAVLALLGLSIAAQAAIIIDTVAVGNKGNAADTRYATPGYGAVSDPYNIGKYEVTAAQYTDFLNKVARTDTYGLYNTSMDSSAYGCQITRHGNSGSYTYDFSGRPSGTEADWANRPVNYVSYWDSCRFANWLHNGQPTGLQTAATTERGAYTLDGYNGIDGCGIQRNANWKWAVTSEDEWYKAAYYKSGSANAGYWDYPMRSDISTTPSNAITNPDGGNNANFYGNGYTIGSPYYRTNVGEFELSASAYGTFDQGGNVWEWNEAVVYQAAAYGFRGLRGSSFENGSGLSSSLQASYRDGTYPDFEEYVIGFRVSEVVPEPSSIIALAGGLVSLLGIRRRRA